MYIVGEIPTDTEILHQRLKEGVFSIKTRQERNGEVGSWKFPSMGMIPPRRN